VHTFFVTSAEDALHVVFENSLAVSVLDVISERVNISAVFRK
jgi:hypothetical protein